MTNFIKTDKYFIHYLAPTLCGIKPANLFTLSESDFAEADFKHWENRLKKQNLNLKFFKNSENRWIIFAYDFIWIKKLLSEDLIQSYLMEKAYSNPTDTVRTLEELFLRIQEQNGFPHEVGLFLGYPILDVISFEKNKGQNCKYCGYWKSYCNPKEAEKCCDQYKWCSQMCKQWFEEGHSVPQIIKKYKEVTTKVA